jgi:acetylornithine deacetylase/succinyl-diaminopimelate desuccinylase-like protein
MKLPACLALLAVCAMAAERYPVDWTAAHPEIVRLLSALIRQDTTNPPGNETRAAKVIQSALEREGIPVQLFASDPARANLVARLRGNGSKRPLLLMGHTDTVGVQRENWTVEPFAALRRNNWIYGRGASDDKDHVTAATTVMLLLKRLGVKLDRDIILLAEAGEEGTTGVGIDYLVKDHWAEIAAEFALAEGGSAVEYQGKVRYVLIATTEKVPRGIRLVARGPSGHGSRPSRENAVVHLAAAVARVSAWRPPMRLNDTTREYFRRLAEVSPPPQAARYRALLDPAQAAAADRYLSESEPGSYTLLRTSVVPTMIKGGYRTNVIPSEAEAYLDVRALPDEDMTKFVAELRRIIGDPAVEVIASRSGRPAAPPSGTATGMFRAFEQAQQRMFPGAITIPSMPAGATDSAQLRARGVQAYGFGPVVSPAEGSSGGAHADDERIAVSSLEKLVQFLWYAVLEVAAAR